MMDNLESVLQSLNEFDKSTADKDLTPELEQLLEHIAKTGKPVFPWPLLKPLICFKLEKVLNEFFENGTPSNEFTSEPLTKSRKFLPEVEKLLTNLECFSGPPFTIQRICELITEPHKHYKTTDKFLRGVEKNILVVSTVQPDGSLLTRPPLCPPLANGSLSPTETIPMAPSPTKISHNSPLNTNYQENGFVTSVEPTVATTDEKQSVDSAEVCRDDVQQEATRNGNEAHDTREEIPQEEEVKTASEKKKEDDKSSSDTNVQQQEEVNIIKEVEESQDGETKVEEQVENDEKPAVEPTEKKQEEKMDES